MATIVLLITLQANCTKDISVFVNSRTEYLLEDNCYVIREVDLVVYHHLQIVTVWLKETEIAVETEDTIVQEVIVTIVIDTMEGGESMITETSAIDTTHMDLVSQIVDAHRYIEEGVVSKKRKESVKLFLLLWLYFY